MIEIRPEQPADRDAIRAVHVAAFPTEAEARLVDALRAAGRLSISLAACDGDLIVGHIAFSPVTVAGASGAFGLAPVAVLPGNQRQGIGAELIRAGLAACARLNAPFVVVLGDPAYYARFGFQPARRWGLLDEYNGGPAFQAIELQPGEIPLGAGLVKYAPQFACDSDEIPD